MKNIQENYLNNERSVEIPFVVEMLAKYFNPKCKILDIGGIPSVNQNNKPITDFLKTIDVDYNICDFRGGKYRGDFVTIDIKEKFDIIIFLSSLEHFPQCTEGDVTYRDGEDIKGFKKAYSLLNPNGKIILTIPFGKHMWQPYHQTYNWKGLLTLTQGSSIIESYIYRLINNEWIKIDDPFTMEDVAYTDKAYGVGCFILG